MRRIRRPIRFRSKRLFRRSDDNPKLTMILEIDNFPKGSEFTAKDYLAAHPDNLKPEEVEEILNDLIQNNNIDLSVKEENSVKIYTKTKDSLLPIYSIIENIMESEGEFDEKYIIREDLSYSMCSKIKDEVFGELISQGMIRKIQNNQYEIISNNTASKYNIVSVLLKALDMPKDTDWTLRDVLGGEPDLNIIKDFESILYNDYESMNFSIYKKGFNNKGDMVYTLSSGEASDNLASLDVNSILEN